MNICDDGISLTFKYHKQGTVALNELGGRASTVNFFKHSICRRSKLPTVFTL